MPFSLHSSCISFDSESYSAGDTVSGTVSFITDKPLSARFIKISLIGEARVHTYHTKRIVSNGRYLWKSTDGENTFPAGKHCYYFSFTPSLPEDAEPSFRGPNGAITYKIYLTVNRPWALDLQTEKEFLVTCSKEGKALIKKENVARGYTMVHVPGTIFTEGNISMMVKMPKLCFTPGETLIASVEIENNSSRPIRSLGLKFFRLSHYHLKPQHLPCSVRSQCPLSPDQKSDSEEILKVQKNKNIFVKPFSCGEFTMKLQLDKKLTPIFESPMISIGYKMQFSCSNDSLTNNKVRINVPLALRTDKSDKEAPPPYFI